MVISRSTIDRLEKVLSGFETSIRQIIAILVYLPTSNARRRTRLALSRTNGASELWANYLLIKFQKANEADSRWVFLFSSSRRLSSASWAREGRTCRTFLRVWGCEGESIENRSTYIHGEYKSICYSQLLLSQQSITLSRFRRVNRLCFRKSKIISNAVVQFRRRVSCSFIEFTKHSSGHCITKHKKPRIFEKEEKRKGMELWGQIGLCCHIDINRSRRLWPVVPLMLII